MAAFTPPTLNLSTNSSSLGYSFQPLSSPPSVPTINEEFSEEEHSTIPANLTINTRNSVSILPSLSLRIPTTPSTTTPTHKPFGHLQLQLDQTSIPTPSHNLQTFEIGQTPNSNNIHMSTSTPSKHDMEISKTGTLKSDWFEIRSSGFQLRGQPNTTAANASDQYESQSITATSSDATPVPLLTNVTSTTLVELGAIGKGASGFVMKALHLPTSSILALKCIDVINKKKRSQVLKELKEFNTTEIHPNIVRFYGAYFTEGSVKLALEYMNRGSLQSIVTSHGPLSEIVIANVTKQILSGLLHLHFHHKIHRDIKPANMLLDYHGNVKVSDFGIIAELESTLSKCNTFVGTTMYMSPERLNANGYNYSADIWSLGMSLWTLAIGECPLKSAVNDGFWGLMAAVSKDDIASTFPAHFSDEFRDFMKCCLHLEPSARWSAVRLLDHPFVKCALSVEKTLPHWPKALDMVVNGDVEAEMRERMKDRLPGDMKRTSVSLQRQLLNYSHANSDHKSSYEKNQKENILRYSNVNSRIRPSGINTALSADCIESESNAHADPSQLSEDLLKSTEKLPTKLPTKQMAREPRNSLLSQNFTHSRHSSMLLETDMEISGWIPMSARPAEEDFMPNLDKLYDQTPFESPKVSPLPSPKQSKLVYDDLTSLQKL